MNAFMSGFGLAASASLPISSKLLLKKIEGEAAHGLFQSAGGRGVRDKFDRAGLRGVRGVRLQSRQRNQDRARARLHFMPLIVAECASVERSAPMQLDQLVNARGAGATTNWLQNAPCGHLSTDGR